MRSALGERIATALTYWTISRRMNLFRHRALSVLAIGAVATSAALAVSVEIASRSVRTELVRTATALVGSADLEVVSSRRGVPEALIDVVRGIPGVVEASPMIGETVRIVTGDPAGLPLHVVGVDLIAERKSYDFEVQRRNVRIRDPLALLAKPDAVLITAALAERLGLDIGARLPVRLPSGRRELAIEALIAEGDFARAYQGQIAVMDVWALQHLVDSPGFVDRIDVTTDPTRRAEATARLREAVGTRATVREAKRAEGVVEAMVGVLDLIVWGVPFVAVFLAALLSYAAMSQLVRSRVRQLALMQCVGVDTKGIFALVAVDALVLSGIGTVLGLGIGVLLSPVLVRGFSGLSEHVGQVAIDNESLDATSIAVAALVWLAVAATATIAPARRVARSSPLSVLTNSQTPEGLQRTRRWPLAHAALTALALIALTLLPRDVDAGLRLLAIVASAVLVLLVSGTDCLRWLVTTGRRAFDRIPRVGRFVGLSILARPVGSGISMAAISSVFAFAVVLLTVVESTIASMDEWLSARAGHSATVFAGAPNSGLGGEGITPKVLEIIRSTDGVEDLSVLFTTNMAIDGRETPVLAISSEVALRRHGFYPNDTPPDELVAALRRGEVAMSYAFGHFFGKDIGDTVTLPTRGGARSFRIGGVIRNYAGPTGTLMFDLDTFDRWFARDGATQARIWSRRPFAEVQRAIEARVGDEQPLFFRYDDQQRDVAARNFQRFRALLYVIIAIAALFCSAALLNLLTASVTSRQRELAIMQTVGARPSDVALSVVVDALILSAVGAAVGVLVGALTGRVLCDFLFQRLGWIIDYRVQAFTVFAPVGVLLAACVLIGVIPALQARRSDPVRLMSSG